jgi:Fur family ferric uptake transcriptional regulator
VARSTQQRRAILEALQAARRPLSPAEVLKAARRRVRGMGLATVYRAMSDLSREKKLSAVELPGSPPRYELAGQEHHHHFECTSCGRVYELKACPSDIQRLKPRGVRVEAHELVLYGRCADCLKK